MALANGGLLKNANSDRQQRIACYVDFGFGDLVSGNDYAAVWVPSGATDIVLGLQKSVAWNSATTDVIDIGNETTENAYLNDGNLANLTALTTTGLPISSSTGFWITIRWVGAGTAPTAGAARLFLSYIMEGRGQFNHGPDRYPHD